MPRFTCHARATLHVDTIVVMAPSMERVEQKLQEAQKAMQVALEEPNQRGVKNVYGGLDMFTYNP